MINANDYAKEAKFYSWLLPKLGFSKEILHETEEHKSRGWKGEKGGLWLSESEKDFRSDTYDKRRVGLREIAFSAESNSLVDEIAKGVEHNGGKMLDQPHEWNGGYRTFFLDPEGIKLEVVVR